MTEENPGSILLDEPAVDLNTADQDFDATEAFLADATTEKDEEGNPLSKTESGETETEGKEATPPATEDDPEVDIKVGDETRKAKLSDLKRLFGQEAALTQKSQIVAELRSQAESQAQYATTALTKLVERADKAWEPYAKLDFLALSTQMEPADFAALRAEASQALTNKQFFSQELEGITKATAERHAVTHRERAAATVAELEDPIKGIKGWGKELYGEVANYAVSQGMPETVVRSIVEAPALRLIHKAMLYDRAQATAKVAVKQAPAKPTITLKPGAAKASSTDGDGFRTSLANMKSRGGGLDATADAFLAHARRSAD